MFFWNIVKSAYIVPFVYIATELNLMWMFQSLDIFNSKWIWGFFLFTLLYWAMEVWRITYFSLVVAGLKKAFLYGMDDIETYPVNSLYYFRRWAADLMMGSTSSFSKLISNTYFNKFWWQLMGTTVGWNTEISTATGISADKVTVGENAFLNDDMTIGMPYIESGIVRHAKVTIANEAFLGNRTVIPPGTHVPEGVLLGVTSLIPETAKPNVAYIGVPPMEIKREAKPGMDDADLLARTYKPATKWIIRRCLLEALGLLACFYCTGVLVTFDVLVSTALLYRHDATLLCIPIIAMVNAILGVIIARIAKTVVLYKYKVGDFPLYSLQVVRCVISEFFEMMFAGEFAFPVITGTIWASWYFRIMGAKIGKRCYFHGSGLTEHDLMVVGDYVVMEPGALLQGHLFQDRVRSTGPITIGDYSEISHESIVLMYASMGEKTTVGGFSLVPRYEQLPSKTKWHGITVIPAPRESRSSGTAAVPLTITKTQSIKHFTENEPTGIEIVVQ